MRSVNKAILVGHVTWKPELKHLDGGKTVCTFGLATNRNWTNGDGEKKEDTDFHKIVAWGKLAEICHSYLSKGRLVYVEGRIQGHSWEDADGIRRAATEIIIDDMSMLDAKKPETHEQQQPIVTQPENQPVVTTS